MNKIYINTGFIIFNEKYAYGCGVEDEVIPILKEKGFKNFNFYQEYGFIRFVAGM